MTIWALHGFLGLPSDYDKIQKLCLEQNPNLKWKSLDYLHMRELSPQNSLSEWGENLNRLAQKQSAAGEENILLGYSQGGRLALHAIQKDPKFWKSAIIVSSNPGINAWEKPARMENDQDWAVSFLTEKFDKVVERWNAATVFQGSKIEPHRPESSFNRRQLADCLINWSVAKQQDFRPFLDSFQGDLHYICGEKDSKYCQIGKDLESKNKKINFIKIPNSGHRVIFDQPETLTDVLLKIIGPQ